MSKSIIAKFRKTRFFDELLSIRIYLVSSRKYKARISFSSYFNMRSCFRKYGWRADEFFLYNYESLTDEERASFVSEVEYLKFTESVNSKPARRLLSDKWSTFEYFKKFFKREACLATLNNNGGGIMS